MSAGVVSVLWKQPNVTPIFKKGSKLKPSNYRPVSLTSVLCKVMEGLIHERITNFTRAHGLITKDKHGFVHGKGCGQNLLESRDILTEAIHMGAAADVIYTDFAKAFDMVPHKCLLLKLQAYGISGTLLKWIEALVDSKEW